jgi:hypothetical protein
VLLAWASAVWFATLSFPYALALGELCVQLVAFQSETALWIAYGLAWLAAASPALLLVFGGGWLLVLRQRKRKAE